MKVSAEKAKDRVVYLETDALEDNEQSIRDLAETVIALWPFVVEFAGRPCEQAEPLCEVRWPGHPEKWCFCCRASKLLKETEDA